jgi:hypothetical protein
MEIVAGAANPGHQKKHNMRLSCSSNSTRAGGDLHLDYPRYRQPCTTHTRCRNCRALAAKMRLHQQNYIWTIPFIHIYCRTVAKKRAARCMKLPLARVRGRVGPLRVFPRSTGNMLVTIKRLHGKHHYNSVWDSFLRCISYSVQDFLKKLHTWETKGLVHSYIK